jgi:ATP-dependent protease ClpP protease subunit
MNKLEIRNLAGSPDTGEILIYGAIGDDYDGISARRFIDELNAAEKARGGQYNALRVRIDSTGGYVQDGFAIYNQLKQHPAEVTTVVDAFALSAASTIAMAGDKIQMHENAVMMIHKPQGFAFGDAGQMTKEAEILNLLQQQIAGVYASRTGQAVDTLNTMIDAETWMSAADAVKLGFADEVIPNGKPSENPDADPEPDGEPFADQKKIPDWVKIRLKNKGVKHLPVPLATWKFRLRRRRLELQEQEFRG